MPPGGWTALFFLDEVTALAAGHRPCGYCRREDLRWFAGSRQRAAGLGAPPSAPVLDRELHAERVDSRTRRQRTRPVGAGELAALPDGVMVADRLGPALVAGGRLLPWSFQGYAEPRDPADGELRLLTPPLAVTALAAGYRPLVHPSAATTTLRVAPWGRS